MGSRQRHDVLPPPNWPESITYIQKPRLSTNFPSPLIPLISPSGSFNPSITKHPSHVQIRCISQVSHPANGQNGLFAKTKIKPNELIIPYNGVIHSSFISENTYHDDQAKNGMDNDNVKGNDKQRPDELDEHEESDYDLSLLRISSSQINNPFPGYHVSIGIDAAQMGNAARFVNDYRGVKNQPNAEFRIGNGEKGELRMEIWTLKKSMGISKGDEILVSYGKGWWGSRK
ncbi:uncharacterized protein IL334_003292 [Kwoniella shivajii]|uniref:SET domain-containing protein n=1 Tax=Kwoniella shivajii TaxID=564305 RepID=A0ABZ1CX54_9TREE|nr:hypothetical protein IL334_003292 [Kwoniella shivajii]